MDFEERYELNEEARRGDTDKVVQCTSCFKLLNNYELADPIKVAGDYICDSCCSEMTRLGVRFRTVNEITEDLVNKHNNDLYNRVYASVNAGSYNRLRHI